MSENHCLNPFSQYQFNSGYAAHHVVRYPKLVALSLEYFLLPCLLPSLPFHLQLDSLSIRKPYHNISASLPAEPNEPVIMLKRTALVPDYHKLALSFQDFEVFQDSRLDTVSTRFPGAFHGFY